MSISPLKFTKKKTIKLIKTNIIGFNLYNILQILLSAKKNNTINNKDPNPNHVWLTESVSKMLR